MLEILFSLSLIFGLPSVGVCGTAGGPIVVEGSVDEPPGGCAGDMAVVGGKYDVGEIASGVAVWLKKDPFCWLIAGVVADAGPLDDIDPFRPLILSVSFLGFSILPECCRSAVFSV